MAKSSLLGIETLTPGPPRQDDLALGPSDSSDSGSDVAGLDAQDRDDPSMPVDRALADDLGRPLGRPDARGGGSDTAGTGERRSAAGDAGGREAGDISVDRVFSLGNETNDADPDAPSPADAEAAIAAEPSDEDDDDDEEDERDADGDASADAAPR